MKSILKHFFCFYLKILSLCFLIFECSHLSAEISFESEGDLPLYPEPLIVSLGAACEPAVMIGYSDLRKAAFPFDWMTSFDDEALINMLVSDFKDFFADKYFKQYGPAGHLLQTYYHLEFIHDGNFSIEYEKKLDQLKQKYQRRINRFKLLNKYQGKVYFIRNVCITTIPDRYRFYKPKINAEVPAQNALRLYLALQYVFPDLDFDLIVINCCQENSLKEETKVNDHVRLLRADPYLSEPKRIENYKQLFHRLIKEAQEKS